MKSLKMGRTSRVRKQKHQESCAYNLSSDRCFINLIKWMSAVGWSPACDLQPANFPVTGRGLMAKRAIKEGETVIKIPCKLLITVGTVAESKIGWLFLNAGDNIQFSLQQVLAAFLVWERHLGTKSFWEPYIRTIPEDFNTPLFCSSFEAKMFPSFLLEGIEIESQKVKQTFSNFVSCLDRQDCDVCEHCNKPLTDVFKYDHYLWAWCAVNTRCIYIDPAKNINPGIKLYDVNCMALAPFLDLMNHSNSAKVSVGLSCDGKSFELKTLVPFKKYSQVFISYGCHSNIRLYLDYGFVLASNIYDTLPLTLDDALQALKHVSSEDSVVSHAKYKFIKSHNLTEHLWCTEEGLSLNMKALIFVLVTNDWQKKSLLQKIYTCEFTPQENEVLGVVSLKILEIKKLELQMLANKMSVILAQGCSKSFEVGRRLVNELLCLVSKAKEGSQ